MHSHMCGLTAIGMLENGCGYIWSHEDNAPLEEHNCPKCGLGMFQMKLEDKGKPFSLLKKLYPDKFKTIGDI